MLRAIFVFNLYIERLAATVTRFAAFQGFDTTTVALMNQYYQLRLRHHRTGQSSFLRMADLLPALRAREATNPRDKLYALIPVSLDGADMLDVDYSLSVEEVYIDAAIKFIQKDKTLDILGHCMNFMAESTIQVPSWVPDWTVTSAPKHFFKRGSLTLLNHHQDQFYGKLYHASRDRSGNFKIDKGTGTLFCDGFSYDRVSFVAPNYVDTMDRMEVTKRWTGWLESERVGNFNPATVSRTLVADCYRPTVDVGMRGRHYFEEVASSVLKPSLNIQTTQTHAELGHLAGDGEAHTAWHGRTMVVTERGHLGLAPKHVQVNDLVVILWGGQLPFLLRKSGDYYVLIGETYVDGVMDGEALDIPAVWNTMTFRIK